jgi:hypothetical protein
MPKLKRDPIREDRIHNEAIVEAYCPEEQAMGFVLRRNSGRPDAPWKCEVCGCAAGVP